MGGLQMTDTADDIGAPNVLCKDYGRLRVSGVQLLFLLRILEDSLRLKGDIWSPFCYTHEFREELYKDIIAQQDQEIK
jgi:hypothetical protein